MNLNLEVTPSEVRKLSRQHKKFEHEEYDFNDILRYNYAIDNMAYVNKNIEGEFHLKCIAESCNQPTGDLRERIIAYHLGLVHNKHVNGIDAFCVKSGETFEIKTETNCKSNKCKRGYKLMRGRGVFSGCKTAEDIEIVLEKNDNVVVSGWLDGKIVYLVQFKLADSKIGDKMRADVARIRGAQQDGDSLKSTVEFTWKDWIDSRSLRLKFFNPRLCNKDRINAGLLDRLQEIVLKRYIYQN